MDRPETLSAPRGATLTLAGCLFFGAAAGAEPQPGAPADFAGDPAYGEYLSGECVTCHQRDGDANGIPSITGWHPEDFVLAMEAYKHKHRDNPVMQMIAGNLGEAEIAALAAYFATLGP